MRNLFLVFLLANLDEMLVGNAQPIKGHVGDAARPGLAGDLDVAGGQVDSRLRLHDPIVASTPNPSAAVRSDLASA